MGKKDKSKKLGDNLIQENELLKARVFELENLNIDFLNKNKDLMIKLKQREAELSSLIAEYKKIMFLSKALMTELIKDNTAMVNTLKSFNELINTKWV